MMGVKTHPVREEILSPAPSSPSNASHPGEGRLRPNVPLSLYLNKLLDPNVRPQEQPPQPSMQEQANAPAETPPVETAWRRAKSSAARTLRPASPRRQGETNGRSRAERRTVKARPLSRRKSKTRTSTASAGNGRQKIMMALVPVLGATLVFLMKNPLKVSPVAPVQTVQPATVAPVAAADVEIAWEIPPLYQSGARDPMRLPTPPLVPSPTVEESAAAPVQTRVELVVTGILYSEDRPAAIIDTQLVHEGQQISGATVTRIVRDGVEFERNGQTWKQVVERE